MIKNNGHRTRDEQLEVHQVPLENGHNWVVLKGTEKARIGKYEHETVKADLYVALHSIASEWANEYPLGGGQLVSDVSFLYQGKRLHLEVDLGNMEAERLFSKVERYRQFAGQGEKVIFVLRDGRYKAGPIGTQLMDYCRDQRLGNFISATLLENFLDYPEHRVLITPKNELIALSELG